MIPGIKATLALISMIMILCGIVGLVLYKPIWLMGIICVVMLCILWRDLYRFFSGQNKVNKLKQ